MKHKVTNTPRGETGNVHELKCSCGDKIFYMDSEPSKRQRILEVSRVHELKGIKMVTGTSNWKRS